MSVLVLSIFPGLDLLGHAFGLEGFTVVRGPDVLWGEDFHPPAGRFDGVIGGDPCQSHSALANLVRAKGLEPSFPDLTPEFARVIEEAQPAWFLRENVPGAPGIKPAGYDVRSFLLCNWASLGEEQMRRRRFWFGVREGPCPELRRWIDFALDLPGEHSLSVDGGHDKLDWRPRQAVTADPRTVPVALGGSGKPKQTVSGRHDGEIGVTGGHAGHPPRYTLAEMLELQGLPSGFLDHSPFTMQGKRKLIGNGVPIALGRALAKAIKRSLAPTPTPGEQRKDT